ncbi:hypothetical protein CEXT_369081 [Caerostris extrusa]|uniref:Uncharacterized protein n=1 Tax=Caerostris extrusa TaxID=172846 RepID=A0AAV4YBC9_CAEEX|nr:hypothetical protein CEXT_369081 [Caerostris extrusa]
MSPCPTVQPTSGTHILVPREGTSVVISEIFYDNFLIPDTPKNDNKFEAKDIIKGEENEKLEALQLDTRVLRLERSATKDINHINKNTLIES